MNYVYIIYSERLNRYYVGETYDLDQRLNYHNYLNLNNNSISNGVPWTLYFSIEVENRSIARKIESHIKRMKSRKYIENIKRYPEMAQKLRSKYSQ
jgi:putative endonuclease